MPSGTTTPKALAVVCEPFLSIWRNRDLPPGSCARHPVGVPRQRARPVLGAFGAAVLVAIYTFVFGAVLKSTWAVTPRSQYEVPLIFFTGLIVFGFFDGSHHAIAEFRPRQ